jgi:hypothetical protein
MRRRCIRNQQICQDSSNPSAQHWLCASTLALRRSSQCRLLRSKNGELPRSSPWSDPKLSTMRISILLKQNFEVKIQQKRLSRPLQFSSTAASSIPLERLYRPSRNRLLCTTGPGLAAIPLRAASSVSTTLL